MKKIIDRLREHPKRYAFLKKLYGKTIGLWYFKELFVKYIGFYNGQKRLRLMNDAEGNKMISETILSGKPFMLARYGSTEFRTMFNEKDVNLLHFYSGFFPNDKRLLNRFKKTYIDASKYIDILAIWNYKNHFLDKIKLINDLPNINQLISVSVAGSHNCLWLKQLKNKKILVVHPFKKTIEKQMKKRKQLRILPKMKNLEVIQAVQTIAGNKDPRFKDWFKALDYMKKEIDKKDFDIALFGCGAYGLPLASHVKRKGKQAIHIGGGLQLLFGIKGKRWADFKMKFGKDWIYPLEEDIPKNIKKVEEGCYWR